MRNEGQKIHENRPQEANDENKYKNVCDEKCSKKNNEILKELYSIDTN